MKRSKANQALHRACEKLYVAIDDTEYLTHDCTMACTPLSQEDFNEAVELNNTELEAKRVLRNAFKRDTRKMIADVTRLAKACAAVAAALPAMADEQLARLETLQYTGNGDNGDFH